LWRDRKAASGFRSGVSLHSHTNQSRETLKFLAKFGSQYPFMRPLMARLERRSEANHGMPVNYAASYWTPPMPPRLAFELERGQIEELGLEPMVSLTDHDSITAPLMLQALWSGQPGPVSVEWSVPYGPQSFHLGVHNLPNSAAQDWMNVLAEHTAHPDDRRRNEIFAALHAQPDVLVVFNHPMWDLYLVGREKHAALLKEFMGKYRPWIDALELNGLRNWNENRAVVQLAEKWDMTLISGGDRHGVEPNANINLTNADSFEEFVHEIRHEKKSDILFMPQYALPWKHRILRSAIDAVRYYPHFPRGTQRWDERVYHPDASGVQRPLSDLWPDGTAPWVMTACIALVQLMGRGVVSGGLRFAWSESNELRVALGDYER
jgi:hypothetical protein